MAIIWTGTETTHTLTPLRLSGWTVLRVWRGSVYLRLPVELQRATGGCDCRYCKAHPELVPCWDTLGVPLMPGASSWTLHAPEWQASDRPTEGGAQ